MSLIDEWAERHIMDAQKKGELENLPGFGVPLELDDDTHIPTELRVSYRILKNAGYIPVELQDRQEALTIIHLLAQLDHNEAEYQKLSKRLGLLELKLKQAGLNTDFLHGDYQLPLSEKLFGESGC